MDNPPSPVPGDDPIDEQEDVEPDAGPPFGEADDSEVETDVHMEADDHQEVGTLLAKGKEFAARGADAIALADLIKSYATTVYEVAVRSMRPGDSPAYPAVKKLKIASAEVYFVAGENEAIRMDDPTSSPAIEAAHKIADLMSAHDDELVELAQEVGPKGAAAYRGLLKAIGESRDAEVSWKAPDRPPVKVTAISAQKAYRTLSREGESEADDFTVIGRLSMADDDLNRFKLSLFKGAPRPPQVKGKQVIRGTFEDHVGNLVKEKGLWGGDVEAEIHVEREKAETVATPRDPKYVLISVKASTPRTKGREPMPGSATLDDEVFGDSD